MMQAMGRTHVFDRRLYLIFHVILIVSIRSPEWNAGSCGEATMAPRKTFEA
jgi:hypothetical protein